MKNEQAQIDTGTSLGVLQMAGIGVCEIDLVDGNAEVSSGWKTMLGIPVEADIDPLEDWLNRVHPDDLGLAHETINSLKSGAKSTAQAILRGRHTDGHWVYAKCACNITEWSADGQPLKLHAVHVDVSEEMAQRSDVTGQDDRTYMILEHSPAGTAVFNEAGNVIFCNQVFADYLGYEKEDVIGLPYYKLAWLDNDPVAVQQKMEFYQGKRKELKFESEFICKDKSRRTAMVSANHMDGPNGEPEFLFQLVDISERVKIDRQKDEFVATLSHELKTPLTSIIGSLRLLTSDTVVELPPKAQKIAELAERGGFRLESLINDLLDLKALQFREMKFSFEEASVHGILETVNKTFGKNLKPSQTLSIDMRGVPEDAKMKVDRKRMINVLGKLLSNASKFSDVGTEIKLVATADEKTVTFKVIDQGPGIDEEAQEDIFSRFQQLDSSDVRKEQGLGMGLAIAEGVTKGMKGKIGFENNCDKGATFWLSFRRV